MSGAPPGLKAGNDRIDTFLIYSHNYNTVETWVIGRSTADRLTVEKTNQTAKVGEIGKRLPGALETWEVMQSDGHNLSCSAHSILTALSPTFRKCKIHEKRYLADYFRFHILPKIILQYPRSRIPDYSNTLRDCMTPNRDMPDTIFNVIGMHFNLNIMMFDGFSYKENPTADILFFLRSYHSTDSAPWIFIHNRAANHWEAVRKPPTGGGAGGGSQEEYVTSSSDEVGKTYAKIRETTMKEDKQHKNAVEAFKQQKKQEYIRSGVSKVQAEVLAELATKVESKRLQEEGQAHLKGIGIYTEPNATRITDAEMKDLKALFDSGLTLPPRYGSQGCYHCVTKGLPVFYPKVQPSATLFPMTSTSTSSAAPLVPVISSSISSSSAAPLVPVSYAPPPPPPPPSSISTGIAVQQASSKPLPPQLPKFTPIAVTGKPIEDAANLIVRARGEFIRKAILNRYDIPHEESSQAAVEAQFKTMLLSFLSSTTKSKAEFSKTLDKRHVDAPYFKSIWNKCSDPLVEENILYLAINFAFRDLMTRTSGGGGKTRKTKERKRKHTFRKKTISK